MLTPSKSFFYLCLSFVAGVALESLIYNFAPGYIKSRAMYVLLGFFVAGIMTLAISFWKNKHIFLLVGFCFLFLALGVARFQVFESLMQQNVLVKLNDSSQKITLQGVVADAPDVRGAFQYITVTAQKIIVGGREVRAYGKVLVTLSLYHNLAYLDQIQLVGKLEKPQIFADFNYQNYLLKDGIFSTMYYPKVDLFTAKQQYNLFSFFYEKILFFKQELQHSIQANFSGSDELILEGILLGNNKNMTTQLRNNLNVAGVRYLTAISGVHIIILSSIIMLLLLWLGLWRGQAFYISITFIWLYIILTGCSASGVRAGIMGSIFLLSQKVGRQNTSARTITLAAAVMLLLNPLLLLYDVGFQLSFLAALGIIYGKPLLENLIQMIAKNHARYVVEIIAVTFAAQIFISPILIYNFGNVSLVSPLTSLLILPVMPWIMVSGFLAAAAGIYSHALGSIVAIPCWILLNYFIKIVEVFSGSWASKTISNVSWIWIVVYYGALFVALRFLQKMHHSTDFL